MGSNVALYAEDNGGFGHLARYIKKDLDRTQGHGYVAAARVEAAAYVAHVAVNEIGMLSMEEALIAERSPHAAGRVRLVVDNFAMTAANMVARMGY